MAIADYLTSISNSKKAIKTAIAGKGVSIDDSIALADYAAKIDSIAAGGSGAATMDFANFLTGAATTLSDPNATQIGAGILQNYQSLESISFPKVTETSTNAMRGCTNLKHFEMENLKIVGNYTFYGDSSLLEASLPAVETIGPMAFGLCSAMTQVDIGNKFNSCAGNAFNSCTAVTTININRKNKAVSYAPWGATSATVNWIGTE